MTESTERETFDYIVVGSGAGGAPVAARLALEGFTVLVLEAGPDRSGEPDGAPPREVSQVPAFHGISTEHPDLSWEFFVKHYDDPPAGADPKADKHGRGIFYPRAAALGGCTVHNAMITAVGPRGDWDDLADFLGDESWRADRMRYFFRRLERSEYAKRRGLPTTWLARFRTNVRWLFGLDVEPEGGKHGFDGWLHTSTTDIAMGLRDRQLVGMLKAALWHSWFAGLERSWTLVGTFLRGRIRAALDPNHSETQAKSPEGLALIPLAVCGPRTTLHENAATHGVRRGRRSGPRELLLEVQARHPDRLVIRCNCLVTELVFDEGGEEPRARGVRYLEGERLYGAHPEPRKEPSGEGVAYAANEVILAGGAFNTPQLLMLSGIGKRAELEQHGIRCLVDLPGVGKNLQDRYEVTVISRMKRRFKLLEGASFELPSGADVDRHLREWREEGTGLYTSNGSVLGILKRSRPDLAQPDLFIFGIPLPFRGYEQGYSKIGDQHDLFTWTILKSHTRNHDGTVRLDAKDPQNPLRPPEINFHYFNETSREEGDESDPDLDALVHGVEFVRGIARCARRKVRTEEHPGLSAVPPGNDERIRQWIVREAWGHHASGTCRMGPKNDPGAVLDSRFKVLGAQGLRVVDASIFPRIPGYFIVSNIYVAAEKAADAIIADGRSRPRPRSAYPPELEEAEAEALRARREARSKADPAQPLGPPRAAAGRWSPDVTGLGLSGGGIRSATLNLGVLQALARAKALRRVDLLSTVSGGGFVGSFLGRWYDRLRELPLSGRVRDAAPDELDAQLASPWTREIGWLRKSGNYIAPTGQGDARLHFATFLRNLLSMHLVVGVLLFTLFGVANALRYGTFDWLTVVSSLAGIAPRDLPLGHLLDLALGPFFSPWFTLFELVVLFLALPQMVGYWLASQEEHERFDRLPLLIVFLIASILLLIGSRHGLVVVPLVLALSLLASFVHVELAWRKSRQSEAAVGTGGVETQRLRTRNILTYDLGLSLTIAGGLLGFALIDSVGHGLHQRVLGRVSYAAAFATIGATIAALIPIARYAAGALAAAGEPSEGLGRGIVRSALPGVMAVVLFTVPLVAYSFAAHAVYGGGTTLRVGRWVTLFTLAISILVAVSRSIAFVNRSSLAAAYGARLARAYLGASNPLRHRPEGASLVEVMPGDDVADLRNYRPHERGGPLHLINVTLNQTVDAASLRGNRDRKGENLAVSCLAVSVGRAYHSLWKALPNGRGVRQTMTRRAALLPLGHVPGTPHPLVDDTGVPTQAAEVLSLRQWIAISGAAVSAARGQGTQLGTALLLGLANLRTGYWWDSGISESARVGFPRLSFLRRLLYLVPRVFLTQSLLVFEWVARFPGPWEKFWHLSDGGFFENLGAYELIRRRVPRIIVCDAGADPGYRFDDLGNLIRKVRIDFSASVEPFSAADIAALPQPVQGYLGSLEELRPTKDPTPARSKIAALFWVRYADEETPPSVLLYLKAGLAPSASADVRNYAACHPDFPHESTGDQFFDEAQWESHRKLGLELAWPLFEDPDWFWNIPIPQPVPTARPL